MGEFTFLQTRAALPSSTSILFKLSLQVEGRSPPLGMLCVLAVLYPQTCPMKLSLKKHLWFRSQAATCLHLYFRCTSVGREWLFLVNVSSLLPYCNIPKRETLFFHSLISLSAWSVVSGIYQTPFYPVNWIEFYAIASQNSKKGRWQS